MKRTANTIEQFPVRVEEGQNPYIGVVSFQHFRGEKLYSDIEVLPENKMTETERVECYPVSADAEENGREEGFYPDSSVAYIRVLWKEFEPERGVYNYEFIAKILNEAKAHGQTVIFRLMGHSTRAQDDVPEWLKKEIECPERPPMARVKDSPSDPKYMQYFLEAVRKLGERFDDDPTLDAIDISLPGSWGEGHKLELYSEEFLRGIVDVYTSVFRKTRLVGQSYLPDLLQYANQTVPVGWRGDGLGDPYHTFEMYPDRVKKIEDLWKTAPVSFESYWWLCEWKRRGWDLDKIIEATLGWHLSSFNAKSMPIPYEWEDKIRYWISKMGYHFALDEVAYPAEVCAGDEAEVKIRIENRGVAPIYRSIPVTLRLKNAEQSVEIVTEIDICKWMPGKNDNAVELKIPTDLSAGEYQLEMGIFNEHIPMIYLCSETPRDGAFYRIGTILVK